MIKFFKFSKNPNIDFYHNAKNQEMILPARGDYPHLMLIKRSNYLSYSYLSPCSDKFFQLHERQLVHACSQSCIFKSTDLISIALMIKS